MERFICFLSLVTLSVALECRQQNWQEDNRSQWDQIQNDLLTFGMETVIDGTTGGYLPTSTLAFRAIDFGDPTEEIAESNMQNLYNLQTCMLTFLGNLETRVAGLESSVGALWTQMCNTNMQTVASKFREFSEVANQLKLEIQRCGPASPTSTTLQDCGSEANFETNVVYRLDSIIRLGRDIIGSMNNAMASCLRCDVETCPDPAKNGRNWCANACGHSCPCSDNYKAMYYVYDYVWFTYSQMMFTMSETCVQKYNSYFPSFLEPFLEMINAVITSVAEVTVLTEAKGYNRLSLFDRSSINSDLVLLSSDTQTFAARTEAMSLWAPLDTMQDNNAGCNGVDPGRLKYYYPQDKDESGWYAYQCAKGTRAVRDQTVSLIRLWKVELDEAISFVNTPHPAVLCADPAAAFYETKCSGTQTDSLSYLVAGPSDCLAWCQTKNHAGCCGTDTHWGGCYWYPDGSVLHDDYYYGKAAMCMATGTPCTDAYADCSWWAGYYCPGMGYTGWEQWMLDYCPVSCRACTSGSASESAVGFADQIDGGFTNQIDGPPPSTPPEGGLLPVPPPGSENAVAEISPESVSVQVPLTHTNLLSAVGIVGVMFTSASAFYFCARAPKTDEYQTML